MAHTQRQQVGGRGQCSSRLFPLLLLLLPFAAQPGQAAIHIPSNFKRPPVITTQPESVTVFSVEDLVMSCEATGNPPPIFRWTKDGEEFDPGSDPELKVSQQSGSFVFYTLSNTMDTLKQYQGKYVCYASNELGTAVSNEAILKTDERKVHMKSEQGNSIVLKCNPPQSSMKPIIHWMDRGLHHIELSQRVVSGKDGNLYFAHLTAEDSKDDYTCNVQYLATRTILAKEPITLTVTPSNSVVRNKRPQMMRPTGSHSTYHALKGQTLELECIVQGLPTPDVSWLRKDGELSESRTVKDMFDRRLLFSNISETDGGEYQCRANNSQGKVTHTYTVIVEAAPYWTKEPVSQLYAPGETVKLDCQADGIPPPMISWTINGIPISETDEDSRRTLTASGSLILNDVTFGDTAIYQCRASNKHGTILTNTNVYVIELPPQILTEDGNTYTFTEGQKALLECETFGSPKPKVICEILTHRCVPWHLMVLSPHTANVSLLSSPDRTVIVSPPQALKVQPGTTAIFTCLAIVDPKLGSPLIQWRKDGLKLFESHIDEKNVYVSDASFFFAFCIFPSLLDSVSPEYVVEFEDQDLKEIGWEELTRVSENKVHARLSLWPYMSYRFRVIAINEVGKSDSSKPSEIHNTLAEAPDRNPEDVRSESTNPNTLEMEKHDFSGPDFKYKVMWRKVVGSGPNWHIDYTTAPPFTVSDVGNFSAFEIKVQAVNEKGEGPEPDPVIGYSGEDSPLEPPVDVGVELINSSTIKVTWAAVDRESVRGHLLGYKIYLVRLGSRAHHQGRRATEPESPVVLETGANEEKKVISSLTPYSHYTLVMTVFNSKGEGPASEMLSFKTDEGVPGPPMSLMLDSPSETEMTLHWTPPDQPNGVLIGYLLQYQQSDDDSPMQVVTIDDSAVTHLTLRSLDRHSHYRFYLRGRTAAGDGEPIMQDGATIMNLILPSGWISVPPSNISLSVGENSVNLSWVAKKRHRNVSFQIHYLNKNGNNVYTDMWIKRTSLHFLMGIVQPSFATQGWFIGVVSAIVLLLLILLILCFIKRSKGGKYSVKDKEEGPMDSEARPMKDETFGEYSDLEEKRTASLPSLGEESKLCSEDNLDYNGSSAVTTELNMDESLVSQFSRPSEGPETLHGLPDNSPLNPNNAPPANNGMPNSVTILD
uniref:L1 cell adhesion molecule, paralog a n=1 Tax=Mastacembelus armatus TaxID=205130 RepID=A0A7N9ANL8_9TELE